VSALSGEWISWDDADTYAQWLTQLTGEPLRLPTEAEWEKAARGTDGRIYPWGNQWDKTRANTRDGGPGATTPVGTYPSGASQYGAEDMAGNVLEWTSTLYEAYPYNPTDGRENQYTPGDRVLRGGSWANYPTNVRSAYRFVPNPSDALNGYGFRLVRAASGS
jgi:formylglycine-generating enzyme required for sulfatase activity